MAAGRGYAPLPAGAERTKLGRGISSELTPSLRCLFKAFLHLVRGIGSRRDRAIEIEAVGDRGHQKRRAPSE